MIHHCSPKSESLSGSTTMPCGSNILSHTTNRTAWQRADAVGALSQTGARKKSRERARRSAAARFTLLYMHMHMYMCML